MRRKLIAGNWKMNGLMAQGLGLTRALLAHQEADPAARCDVVVCPPAHLLAPVRELLGEDGIALGAQDCHFERAGAHTGDISAAMLADLGCGYVIVGHSERRADHGETDPLVKAKAEAALGAGLVPIVCVGETETERAGGRALAVIERQVTASLARSDGARDQVIAYEPVWAIGTGKTATPEDIAEAHGHIRRLLGTVLDAGAAEHMRILYGGSVKPDNAAELLAVADVDGALVGGASLKAEDFWAIVRACP